MSFRTNRFNTGKPFERIIETTLTQYAAKGLLRAKKVDPPMRFAGGRLILLPSPFLDYVGVWAEAGGRAVFFEAKSTKHSLPIDRPGGLTENQVEALRHWHNAGAIAFVLWQFKAEQVFLFTWPKVQDVLTRRRSIRPEDCHLVQQGSGFVLCDFLPVVRRLWGGS